MAERKIAKVKVVLVLTTQGFLFQFTTGPEVFIPADLFQVFKTVLNEKDFIIETEGYDLDIFRSQEGVVFSLTGEENVFYLENPLLPLIREYFSALESCYKAKELVGSIEERRMFKIIRNPDIIISSSRENEKICFKPKI